MIETGTYRAVAHSAVGMKFPLKGKEFRLNLFCSIASKIAVMFFIIDGWVNIIQKGEAEDIICFPLFIYWNNKF